MKPAPFPHPQQLEHERCTYVGGPCPVPREGSASSDSGSQLPHRGLWGATDTPCWRRGEVGGQRGRPTWLTEEGEGLHPLGLGWAPSVLKNQSAAEGAAASVAGQRCRVKVFVKLPVSFVKETDCFSSELCSFKSLGLQQLHGCCAEPPVLTEASLDPISLPQEIKSVRVQAPLGSCCDFPIC